MVNGIDLTENEPNNTFINEGNLELIDINQIDGQGFSGTGVLIVNGTIINNGYWKVNEAMNVNYSGGSFTNGPCALLEVNGGRVLTYNRLANNGFIIYDYTGGFYNDMSGINNGAISTTRNHIGGIENNNNGLILKPRSGVCTIPNLATIGTHNTFVIGSNFYSDPAQTTLTATYSNNTLQFTGNQINTQRLYASVTNPANNCSRVIPVWAFFIDNTPPTITCPANITTSNDANSCDAMVTYISFIATDNCNSPSKLTITGFPLSGSFFSVGTTPVNWTATDKKNNTSHCDFDVTVVEQGVPTPTGWTNGGVGSNPNNNCATIQGYISADGVNWTLVKSYPNVLSSPLYLVLFAKTGGAQGIATIDNISINGTASRMSLMTEETALSLEAYPNPFSEDLFIKVANALPGETYHVRLSNMMGQRVYGYEAGASPEGTIDQRISLEHLAAGTYLLEVSAGVQRKAIKVQKF